VEIEERVYLHIKEGWMVREEVEALPRRLLEPGTRIGQIRRNLEERNGSY